MRGAGEFALAASVAAGLHLVALSHWAGNGAGATGPQGGAPEAALGGAALGGADAALADLVAAWDRPPEVGGAVGGAATALPPPVPEALAAPDALAAPANVAPVPEEIAALVAPMIAEAFPVPAEPPPPEPAPDVPQDAPPALAAPAQQMPTGAALGAAVGVVAEEVAQDAMPAAVPMPQGLPLPEPLSPEPPSPEPPVQLASGVTPAVSPVPAARPERAAPVPAAPASAAPASAARPAPSPGQAAPGGQAGPGQGSASRPGLTDTARQSLVAGWGGAIRAQIERGRPRIAGRGAVTIVLRVARDGRLLDATIGASSGQAALDRAALSMVQRAGRFRAAPEGLTEAQYTFRLSIRFD